ncbi:Verru_Chthon cassette protein C, partial [bacterium]|nr:Verru_Chthon cassette protein C [bacterium]
PGFSILELLVAMSVLALLVMLAAAMINSIQSVWKSTSARSEQYRAARQGLETIASRLSQATLNPYWVVTTNGNGQPIRYERQSDLRLISGRAPDLTGLAQQGGAIFFQAPTGYSTNSSSRLDAALNTWGYFVEYGDDAAHRPSFLTSVGVQPRNRFRLMEFLDPCDNLQVFQVTSGNPTYTNMTWFSTPLGTAENRRVLAENIVAIVMLPRLSSTEDPTGTALAPGFSYDSTATRSDEKVNPRHQLPPIVDLAVVAIDENSARRIAWGSSPPDFGTSALFQSPSEMENDLETLRSNLEARGLSARVFRTSVPIAAARWSVEQKN